MHEYTTVRNILDFFESRISYAAAKQFRCGVVCLDLLKWICYICVVRAGGGGVVTVGQDYRPGQPSTLGPYGHCYFVLQVSQGYKLYLVCWSYQHCKLALACCVESTKYRQDACAYCAHDVVPAGAKSC